MAEYPIPPWLAPQDIPGLAQRSQIAGANIGLEQQAQSNQMKLAAAAQRFKEQQAARQAQLESQEQARAETEMNLKLVAAANKNKAMQQYQQALDSGMDPLSAILKFGPRMEEPGAAMAAGLRSQATSKSMQEAPMPRTIQDAQGNSVLVDSKGFPHYAPRAAIPKGLAAQKPLMVPQGSEWDPGDPTKGLPPHFKVPQKALKEPASALTIAQRSAKADRLQKSVDGLTKDHPEWAAAVEAGEPPDPKMGPRMKAEYMGILARAKLLKAQIDDLDAGGNGMAPARGQTQDPAPAPTPGGGNIKRISLMGQGGPAASPQAAAAPPAAPLPDIPGLRASISPQAPGTSPGAMAQMQARAAAPKAVQVAAAKHLYDTLKGANTGKGTFMAPAEYATKREALQKMLAELSPEEQQQILGQQAAPAPQPDRVADEAE